jgi:hypothetical protein
VVQSESVPWTSEKDVGDTRLALLLNTAMHECGQPRVDAASRKRISSTTQEERNRIHSLTFNFFFISNF